MARRLASLFGKVLKHFDVKSSITLQRRHPRTVSAKPLSTDSGSSYADDQLLHVSGRKRTGNVSAGPTAGGANAAVPTQSDVVIVGGGIIGMSTAFWLKRLLGNNCSVTVIERDFTYTQAATTLSNGGIRQQFSMPENILMSLFTAEFLRNIREYLSVPGEEDVPDVGLFSHGYLFLATEKGAHVIRENHQIQVSLGAKVELMTEPRLREKFPWMRTDDLVLGSLGLANEGAVDPWLLLSAFRKKASSLGVQFVRGNVVGFESAARGNSPLQERVLVASTNHGVVSHTSIGFGRVVICAGPWSGSVARLAGVGTGTGSLAVDLPVEPRKRYMYMFHCPGGPEKEFPMIIDSSGAYVRRYGSIDHYVCGASQPSVKLLFTK